MASLKRDGEVQDGDPGSLRQVLVAAQVANHDHLNKNNIYENNKNISNANQR